MGGMRVCGLYECHMTCQRLPGCVHDYSPPARASSSSRVRWREALIFAGLVVAIAAVMGAVRIVRGG